MPHSGETELRQHACCARIVRTKTPARTACECKHGFGEARRLPETMSVRLLRHATVDKKLWGVRIEEGKKRRTRSWLD